MIRKFFFLFLLTVSAIPIALSQTVTISGHVTEEIPLVDPEMSVQEDAAEVYIDAGDFDEAAPQEDVLEVYEDAGGYEGNMSFDKHDEQLINRYRELVKSLGLRK